MGVPLAATKGLLAERCSLSHLDAGKIEIWDPVSTKKQTPAELSKILNRDDVETGENEDATEVGPATVALSDGQRWRFPDAQAA